MFDSQSESSFRGLLLIDRFRERDELPWAELKESADRTACVVRATVKSIFENRERVGDQELKTLSHICQNSRDSRSADAKQELVRELGLPEEDTQQIVGLIDPTVGSVGQSMRKP